jgi:hypothetical protein
MNQLRRQSIQNYQAERGNTTGDAHREGIYYALVKGSSPTQQKAN